MTGSRGERRAGRPAGGGFLVPALLLGALAAGPARADEVRVEARLDRPSAAVGERVVLQVTVAGGFRSLREPVLPELAAFETFAAGRSSNISWVNGDLTTQYVFQYVLVPKPGSEGRQRIGPVRVELKGTEYRSAPIELEVVAAGAGDGGAPAPAAPRGSPPPGAPQREEAVSGSPGDPMFVTCSVDQDEVYVNEQVIYRLRFYRRVDPLETPEYVPPATTGFWVEPLEPQETGYATVQGARYIYTEIRSALFPTHPGALEIGSATLRCQVRSRSRALSDDPFDLLRRGTFDQLLGRVQTITLRSEPVRVKVKPLPEEGKPAGFSGAVGRFELAAELDPPEGPAGQPATLRVTVRGEGNVKSLPDPAFPAFTGLRVYDGKSEVQVEASPGGVRGRKVMEKVLVPATAGRYRIPPVSLAYFDPAHGYRVARSDTLLLAAGPGTTATDGVLGGGGALPVARHGRDIRHIHGEARGWRTAGRGGPGALFWPAQALPFAAVAGAWFWRRDRRRRELDPAWARGREAGRAARRHLARARELSRRGERAAGAAEVARAIGGFVSDRLHLEGKALTAAECAEQLAAAGAPEELCGRARALLDRCDRVRFAPSGAAAGETESLADEAEALLRALARTGLSAARRGLAAVSLLAGLLAAPLALPAWSAGGEPEALFRQGTEAYEQGDFARAAAAYEEALAAGRECAALHYNLGNAWFKLGDLGKAILAYRRAARLAPRDADIRANLALARSRRADSVPEGGLSPVEALRGWVNRSVRLETLLWLGDALLYAACAAAALRLLGRGGAAARRALAALAPAAALALALYGLEAHARSARPEAVVIAPQTEVRSGPGVEYTTEFTLHEGAELRLEEARGGWLAVRAGGEVRGWIPAGDVGRVDGGADAAG